MIHSVIEGVSFALKENLDALESCGQQLDSLWAVGGGAKSEYWLSLLATVWDRPHGGLNKVILARPWGSGWPSGRRFLDR